MELRDYQIHAVNQLRQSLLSGKKRIILQASCGAGKTHISAEIASCAVAKGKKVLFLVNRRDLIKQTAEKYIDFGIGDKIGLIMGNEDSHLSRPIQLATLQTYSRRLKLCDIETNRFFHDADLILYDECFVSGTKIDGIQIENLKIGDLVSSYNHNLDVIEKKPVVKIFKRKPESLCSITSSNNTKITCTKNHPIFSGGKYLRAVDLCVNMELLYYGANRKKDNGYGVHGILQYLRNADRNKEKQQKSSICMFGLSSEKAKRPSKKSSYKMCELWESCMVLWEDTISDIFGFCEAWCRDLFRVLCFRTKKTETNGSREEDSQIQQKIRIGKNEEKKSYVRSFNCKKNGRNKKKKQNITYRTCCENGERKACPNTTEKNSGCFGLGYGSISRDKRNKKEDERHSKCIQNRRCESKLKNRGRDRWRIALWKKKADRSKERVCIETTWVENIKIHEQTSDGKYGGMCPDGYVYNIEVEGNNNYFANGILVHNCHSANAPTYKEILDYYTGKTIIGLSATPMGANGTGLGKVFEEIVTCISMSSLVDKNYLVPAIHYAPSAPDLEGVKITAGDYNKKELGDRVNKPKLVGDILDNWLRLASDRQTIIFATNVKHSKYIKQTFEDRGIPTAHIDAHTKDEYRQNIYRGFENGTIQVLTNVGVACEGSDLPWASAVVIAKPTLQLARYLQMAGRGARPYPGKENFLLLDHAGCIERHGFCDEDIVWSLNGKKPAAKKAKKRKKEDKIFICEMCHHAFTGKRCKNCGNEVKGWGKKIETAEAELVKVKGADRKKFTADEKRNWYGMFEYYRREKGYAPGWTAHKYKEKIGVWPRGMDNVAPIHPTQEFKNYITYLAIKWTKSKRRENNGDASRGTKKNCSQQMALNL